MSRLLFTLLSCKECCIEKKYIGVSEVSGVTDASVDSEVSIVSDVSVVSLVSEVTEVFEAIYEMFVSEVLGSLRLLGYQLTFLKYQSAILNCQSAIAHWEELLQSVSDFIFSKHCGCTPRGVRGVKRPEIL